MATGVRRHLDIVTAGLAILGAAAWIAARAVKHADGDIVVWGIAWTIGAVLAAHISRRVIDLDIAQTLIAAAVASALLVGVLLERYDIEFSMYSLGPSGLAALGAIIGALVPARAIPLKSETVMVIAVAACGHGAMQIMASGCALVEPSAYAIGLYAGAALGSVLAAYVTGAGVKECALALAAMGASTFPRTSGDQLLGFVVPALAGAVIGAAGGWLGARLRARLARPDVPPARVH
jgi:hypothetical protein